MAQDKQPWKFTKEQVLAYAKKLLTEDDDHNMIVIESGDGWGVDIYGHPRMSIADGVALIDIENGDLVEFALELGGRPFTSEEIDRELAAIQAIV